MPVFSVNAGNRIFIHVGVLNRRKSGNMCVNYGATQWECYNINALWLPLGLHGFSACKVTYIKLSGIATLNYLECSIISVNTRNFGRYWGDRRRRRLAADTQICALIFTNCLPLSTADLNVTFHVTHTLWDTSNWNIRQTENVLTLCRHEHTSSLWMAAQNIHSCELASQSIIVKVRCVTIKPLWFCIFWCAMCSWETLTKPYVWIPRQYCQHVYMYSLIPLLIVMYQQHMCLQQTRQYQGEVRIARGTCAYSLYS
jgi:hypothetical protein